MPALSEDDVEHQSLNVPVIRFPERGNCLTSSIAMRLRKEKPSGAKALFVFTKRDDA